MKQTVLSILIAALVGFSACQDQGTVIHANQFSAADSANFTEIKWLDSMVNFDTIHMGEMTTVHFRLKNIGKKPLYISNVKAGCGCTVPDYTKGAIPPGGEGFVSGAFDSKKAHEGVVSKSIFVTTNTMNGINQTLTFRGIIIK